MNIGQLMELIIAKLAGIPAAPILVLFSLIGLAFGVFMVINPAGSIEIQRRFYYLINWKIESVSVPKEIRNTRLMGWFLIFLSVTTLFLIFKEPASLF